MNLVAADVRKLLLKPENQSLLTPAATARGLKSLGGAWLISPLLRRRAREFTGRGAPAVFTGTNF
jgi:hypothetical protein